MDLSKDLKDDRAPDLHCVLIKWLAETFGEEWFWANCDFHRNFFLIGQKPNKILMVAFDNKSHYIELEKAFGVYDYSVRDDEPLRQARLLMRLNLFDPNFFSDLEKLCREFTPLTIQDDGSSNLPSGREILRTTLGRSNLKSS